MDLYVEAINRAVKGKPPDMVIGIHMCRGNYKGMYLSEVYDPKKGEPIQHISPGREFSDLPDDWQCPICGASKKNFTTE